MSTPKVGDTVLLVHLTEKMSGHELIEALTDLAGRGQYIHTVVPVKDGQVLVFHALQPPPSGESQAEILFDSGAIIQ